MYNQRVVMEETLKALGFEDIGGVELYQHELTKEIISFYGVKTPKEIVNKILIHGKNMKAKEIRNQLNID